MRYKMESKTASRQIANSLRRPRLAVSLATLLWAAAVQAAEPGGWYGGVSLGRATFGIGPVGLDGAAANGAPGGSNSAQELQDSGYTARLGYGFSNGLAVEAGYVDQGKSNHAGAFAFPAGSGFGDGLKPAGFNVNVLGHLPVARDLAVFGKVGLLYSDGGDAAASGMSLSSGDKTSRALPGVGLGLNYSMTTSLGLRAEWEKHYRLGTDLSGRGGIDQLSVGVNLKFH